ncbi:Putative corrinoid enzyme (methylcobamide:CoM methyltransferase-related protein) [Desulfatibacillum aliphaticivorans]|uniref:Corrinoid enzyme (Methylcobamide:CoM methyltransferase-related protein) n=1 Tax=Desulfatibacillum aliphaticivorans TaxID=218208 RepID=B8FN08_DESAL|nr:uroporphyrinogen decarboxylase family protein [Desulfatibacillum aliphaticivorans]ACL05878.1 Putative corrinoid enzyme (methylcobamide:CoM methyltransferase-related protein) [Desulfatibacillum aliphaticivorans]
MSTATIFQRLMKGQAPPVGGIPEPLQDALASVASIRGNFSRLSSLERVLTAVRHKEPDRIPVAPLVNAAARRILGVSFPDYSLKAESAAEVFTASVDFVGADFIVLLLDLSVEAADFGQEMVYPLDSTARPNYDNPLIKDVDGYAKIRPVPFEKSVRMKEQVRLCKIMAERVGLGTMAGGFVFGPLGVLSMMRGAEALFKDCLNHPKKVMAACEAVTETLVEFAQAQCEAGMPAVAIDTLYASWNALPKKVWEEIEGPFAGQIAQAIRDKGGLVGVHNCGHAPYFDVQTKAMDASIMSFAHLPDDCATPREMKEKYGDQLTLIGYVPTPLLVHGTPQQIMDECRRQIDVLGRDGGFILAPGCEYPPNIPLDSAFAMIKAVEK